MKGIILAGGSGTRLHPITQAVNKHLLPIYNKPMIYYPLSVVMLAGIRDILLITTPNEIWRYKSLLGDGSNFGIRISYAIQDAPRGIAEAFIIGERFIEDDNVFLILGDNIFYGSGLTGLLRQSVEVVQAEGGAIVFAKYVSDPRRYGVAKFDDSGRVEAIVEKPEIPPSNYAVTGMYIYDNSVVDYAKQLKPSARGELEITDINNIYLREGRLRVSILPRGVAWFDAGTHDSLYEASAFVAAVERRQGVMVGCPEEVAFRNGWITVEDLRRIGERLKKTQYGQYLLRLADEWV